MKNSVINKARNCDACDKTFHPGCIEALASDMLENGGLITPCILPPSAIAILFNISKGGDTSEKAMR